MVSVNLHTNTSVQHFGYIGPQTRSFGVYFGDLTGSISVHATDATTLMFSVVYIPPFCSRCYFSTAVGEFFRVGPKWGNDTLQENHVTCFWHATNQLVNTSLKFTSASHGILSVYLDSPEPWHIFHESADFSHVYNTTFFLAFTLFDLDDTTALEFTSRSYTQRFQDRPGQLTPGFRAEIQPGDAPQFLIDDAIFPDFPPPPTRPDREPPWPDELGEGYPNRGDFESMALAQAMIGVSCISIVAIAVAVVIVAMKRLQRRRKEEEAAGGNELEEVDGKHIPKALITLPQLPNVSPEGLIQPEFSRTDV
jgi:hypothetical protein